ncbi:MAG: Beta-lactamase [Acidobacteriaceae bacterium]|nr:Beta-lactamase [Acidobacteriaceae bacterium]
MLTRRSFLATSTLALSTAALPKALLAEPRTRFRTLPAAFALLEKTNAARLGVFVLDTSTGEKSGYRADERFAMCSTFKFLLAAAVLERADKNQETLTRAIAIPAKVTLGSSPLTLEHAGATMTVRDLCFAIITRSDNTAANLLLDTIGGPSGITRFAQSLGDKVTRLDRTETTLNEAKPGDPRDTTSPAAIVADWQKLLLGNTLSPTSRQLLTDWLIANKTGTDRLRSGLPTGWRVGDKTGANGENTTNNVAIVWLPNHPPIFIAAYLTLCPGPESKRNGIIANVARLVAATV